MFIEFCWKKDFDVFLVILLEFWIVEFKLQRDGKQFIMYMWFGYEMKSRNQMI